MLNIPHRIAVATTNIASFPCHFSGGISDYSDQFTASRILQINIPCCWFLSFLFCSLFFPCKNDHEQLLMIVLISSAILRPNHSRLGKSIYGSCSSKLCSWLIAPTIVQYSNYCHCWPKGMPLSKNGSFFHQNRPIVIKLTVDGNNIVACKYWLSPNPIT